jgi:hypothetical protein
VAILVLVFVAAAALYWTTPYGADDGTHGWRITPWIGQAMRYGLPAFGGFAILAALAASALCERRPGLALAVAVVAAAAATTRFTALAAAALLVAAAVRHQGGRRRAAGAVLVALVATLGSTYLRATHDARRVRAYGGVSEFVVQHVGDDELIGCVPGTPSYALFGPRYERRVVHLPHGKVGRDEWLAMLRRERISVVALGPPLRGRPELAWLTDRGAPFTPIFGRDPRREIAICFDDRRRGPQS